MTSVSSSDRTINYAFLLGGVTATVFGIIFLIRREEALGLIMVLLGLWWLIQGAFMVFSVFVDRRDMGWKIFVGVLGLIAGFYVLANPVESAQVLGSTIAIIFGALGILIGAVAVFGSFRGGGIGALVFGIVSILIGLLFVLNPLTTASVTVTVLAILLLIDGITAIFLALKYK
jgi:uncharacterized membrane protein HdeD (DUF308 family)